MYFHGRPSFINIQMKTQVIHLCCQYILLSANYVLGTNDTKIKFIFSPFKVFIIQ